MTTDCTWDGMVLLQQEKALVCRITGEALEGGEAFGGRDMG